MRGCKGTYNKSSDYFSRRSLRERSTANPQHELLNIFSQINKDGQTILMVTHSVKAASQPDA